MDVSFNELIVDIIRKKFPHRKIEINKRGAIGSIIRTEIVLHTLNTQLTFNAGENLVFIINGHPFRVLKHLPLSHPDTVSKFCQDCLDKFQEYTSRKNVPLVKKLARHYLGREMRVQMHEHATYIYYGQFYLIITPISFFVVKNDDQRTVFYTEYSTSAEIEKAFGLAASFAENIRQGKL